MIIRHIEVCPKCGQWAPWKKRRTMVKDGVRRTYVVCKNCGHKDTVVYVRPPTREVFNVSQS